MPDHDHDAEPSADATTAETARRYRAAVHSDIRHSLSFGQSRESIEARYLAPYGEPGPPFMECAIRQRAMVEWALSTPLAREN